LVAPFAVSVLPPAILRRLVAKLLPLQRRLSRNCTVRYVPGPPWSATSRFGRLCSLSLTGTAKRGASSDADARPVLHRPGGICHFRPFFGHPDGSVCSRYVSRGTSHSAAMAVPVRNRSWAAWCGWSFLVSAGRKRGPCSRSRHAHRFYSNILLGSVWNSGQTPVCQTRFRPKLWCH